MSRKKEKRSTSAKVPGDHAYEVSEIRHETGASFIALAKRRLTQDEMISIFMDTKGAILEKVDGTAALDGGWLRGVMAGFNQRNPGAGVTHLSLAMSSNSAPIPIED